jgi:hypothetical protein
MSTVLSQPVKPGEDNTKLGAQRGVRCEDKDKYGADVYMIVKSQRMVRSRWYVSNNANRASLLKSSTNIGVGSMPRL